jgi:UDP-N-acetylmuramoyl-L-alanyl-D-glutamate--2,6-diaminopimelate ligase
VPDRAAAIEAAFEAARDGDIVLLAGKGHEQTIETAEGAVPWDEAGAARAALARLGHGWAS